jgi:mRNA interferase RelE/StbE
MYKLKFHPLVKSDLKKLDRNTQLLFSKKLKQILLSPEIWKNLWNVKNLNLSWYKKVYFCSKKMRIVYKIDWNQLIIYIISVWKRDDMDVYKNATNRL